jgi:hypothetical protein
MQLKSLAQTTRALNDITSIINNPFSTTHEIRASLITAGRTYTTETLKAALAQSRLNQTQIEAALIGNGLQGSVLNSTTAQLANAASMHAVAEEQAKATFITNSLGDAFKGLGLKIVSLAKFLFTTPLGWLMLLGTAIAAVKIHNDNLEKAKQQIKETAKEAKSSVESIRSDFDSLAANTDQVKKRYAELAQEVENLGKVNQSRGTLSMEDYSEFLDLSNQLAKLFPQLMAGYDDNGNAILNLSGNVNTIVGSLNDMVDVQQKIANQQILDKMPDIWAGYRVSAEEYKETLSGVEKTANNTMHALSQMDNTKTISYDMVVNGEFQHENDILNSTISDTLNEMGIGNVGNDWNGTYHLTASETGTHTISWDFSSLTEDQLSQLEDELTKLHVAYENTAIPLKSQLDSANSEMASYLNLWMTQDYSYTKMAPQLQNAAKALFLQTDWLELLPDSLDPDDWKEVSEWLQENFLYEIGKAKDNPAISKALSEIFTNPELTPEEKANYLNQLQEFFGEGSAIAVSLQPYLEETKDLQNRYQNAVSKFGTDAQGFLEKFFQSNSINDASEIDYWNKVTEGAQNAEAAVRMYRKSLQAPPEAPLTLSQTIDQLNTRIKPAFDSLKSAYQNLFTSDDDGNLLFHRDSLDLSTLHSLKSSIEELNKLEDVDINIDMNTFDTFAAILTDADTTDEQAAQAFNDFATSIFFASQATNGITDETKTLTAQMLESLGVVNAAEAAEYALAEAKAKSALAAYDLTMALENDTAVLTDNYLAILTEGEAAGIARQQLYSLTAAEIAFGQNSLSTEQKIERLKSLAAAYGDTASTALASAIASDLASGHTDADTAIDDLMAKINAGVQKVDIDFSGIEKSAAKAGRNAGKAAGKSYADALKDELSGLNSVIGYIGSILEDQINLFKDQKDAAIDALEAEKEAAEEALNAEKNLLQEKLDAKQAEIDQMEEAAQARKDEISLQKAQYNLERLQNQRTTLQYSESKGMHYVTDTKEIREAKEAVTEAKENILSAGLKKEISDLQDAMDSLDRKIEESNLYYDSLIDQAETYWDSLLKGLEDYKARWQELTEIEEQAKMETALKDLGITTEHLLSMSESTFRSFQGNYLGLLQELYSGNDEMIAMLQKFGGISADVLTPLSDTISDTADSLDRFSGSAFSVNTNVSASADSVNSLNTGTEALNHSLSGISDSFQNLPDAGRLESLTVLTDSLGASVQAFSDALKGIPADIDISSVLAQFEALKNSVDGAVSSISGKAISNGGSGASGSSPSGQQSGSGDGTDSLVHAVKEFQAETDQAIGTTESSGATGRFRQLGQSVAAVAAAIGGDTSERTPQNRAKGSLQKGNGSNGQTLTGSIKTLGETTEKTLGEPDGSGVTGRFGELKDTIADAENHVTGIIQGLNALDGMNAECTVTVNVVQRGSSPLPSLGSARPHVEGTAEFSGGWSAGNSRKTLVGELGQELWVHAKDGTFETVGDNGAEIIHTEKGDLIFNHLQTKELLSKGRLIESRNPSTDISTHTGRVLSAHENASEADYVIPNELPPYDPDKDSTNFKEIYKKWQAHMADLESPADFLKANASYERNKQIHETLKQISHTNISTQNIRPNINMGGNTFQITCPGVTSQAVMREVKNALTREFTGLHNYADQLSRIS